jgi:hypothetical protein
MQLLLQFFGISDPLRLFELELHSKGGPAFAGFRPLQLDDLLGWGQESARLRGWDLELVQRTLINGWIERAESILQWQRQLREEPADRRLVAGLGTPVDWQQRCEQLFKV